MVKGIGRDIGSSTRWSRLADLKRYKVNCIDETKVLEVRSDGVLVENGGSQKVILAALVGSKFPSIPMSLDKIANITGIEEALGL